MMEELHDPYVIRDGSGVPSHAREIARLGLRARQLQAVLAHIQWGGPQALNGRGPCPGCSRFPAQGHLDTCVVAQALQDRDAMTYAEDLIRHLRDTVRTDRLALAAQARVMNDTLLDLESDLDEVCGILDWI